MLWRPRWPAGIALAAISVGGCAAVFGLDEPTVREGSGGGDAATAQTTSGATTGGPGGGEAPSAGGGAPSGSTGAGTQPCEPGDACDDDDRCTDDACVDGSCAHDPIPDGPLVEDLEDCRTIACSEGVEIDIANDAENPPDANPPCRTTICMDGAPTDVDADAGTSCGDPPLECDGGGTCIGCSPQGDDECGEPEECSAPTCLETEICDPGYFAEGTVIADPTDGDCQARQCTGSSVSGITVADDTDVPMDLPCGDARCDGGAPAFDTLTEGTPCNGEAGVCDGLGMDSASCKNCRDTSNTEPDAGCDAPGLPNCVEADPGECRECTIDAHCEGNEDGDDCRSAGVCGCTFASSCNQSPRGRACNFANSRCGCQSDNDCNGSQARGGACLGASIGCGCNSAVDCDEADAGAVCIGNVCGCEDDGDCGPVDDCNLTTHRCE